MSNSTETPSENTTEPRTIARRVRSVVVQSLISIALLAVTGVILSMMLVTKEIPMSANRKTSLNSVEVVPIEPHYSGIDFRVDGEVIPHRSLALVPEISGRVIRKSENCRLGRSVKEGEVLMVIDPIDYQLEVDRLTQTVKQAEVDIDENQVQLENTQKELQIAKEQLEIRERELQRYESSKLPGVYSTAELDTVRSTLLNTKDSIQKLENQCRIYETQKERLTSSLAREKVNLQVAQLNLDRTEVKAPSSGIITSDSFEVNTYVQKGTSVAEILDTSQLEIQCSIYTKQLKWIWLSENTFESGNAEDVLEGKDDLLAGYVFPTIPVTIIYDLDGDLWAWNGTLKSFDGGGVNATTRMVPCRVKVDRPQDVRYLGTNIDRVSPSDLENDAQQRRKEMHEGVARDEFTIPPPTLLSGMYVAIIVHTKPQIPLFRIPEKALLPGNRIWVATEGVLRRYQLRVATTTPEGVLFYADENGPQAVDKVVVSPLAAPKDGDPVHIIERGRESLLTSMNDTRFRAGSVSDRCVSR